ncbi:TPA: hypothetical protein ACGO4F_001930 [Streptococcus suis]
MKKTHITLAAAAAATAFVVAPAVKADVNAKLNLARGIVVDTRSEAVKLNEELGTVATYLAQGKSVLVGAEMKYEIAKKDLEAAKKANADEKAAIAEEAKVALANFERVVTSTQKAVDDKQKEIDAAKEEIAHIDAEIVKLQGQVALTGKPDAQIDALQVVRDQHEQVVTNGEVEKAKLQDINNDAKIQFDLEKVRVNKNVEIQNKAADDKLAAVEAATKAAENEVKEWKEAVAILEADVQKVRVKLLKNGLSDTELKAIIDIALAEAKVEKRVESAVYRLYNSALKVHLYTTDFNEYNVLAERGWNQEGIAFNSAAEGTPVYRLYNADLKVHLYTTDANEYKVLGERGWKQEGVAFNSVKEGKPVYRLYNEGLKKHLYTTDANEYAVLATRGWKQEGVAFNSAN